ncbi:MAG TPA: succinate dehydrogenase cytochrome b558 subunit [Pseudogracilibacillus sp.]|nr:succinate dehydrogenase cytochrome b558 subunit [Pseudogracilibacillus sp.]
MVDQREYYFKRLHSLLGVVPITIFVVQHLIVNHFAVYGEDSFDKAAGFMANLPFVSALEWIVIYLPILFHAVLGVYIVFTTKNNTRSYGYFRNWMFLLQRVSGIITLIFIAWHIWQTKIQITFFNTDLNFQLMEDVLTQPFFFWFYLISIIFVVFHLANGLWSFCVSWGITQSPRSQKVVTYVTVLIFLVVSYIGVRSLFAFAFGA